jgi:predicted  nucleic acid-binding Zn-ribbon protein
MDLFKKALGAFVDFEETPSSTPATSSTPKATFVAGPSPTPASTTLTAEEIEKYSAHFDSLMDQANLPGPDYFEFAKALETLDKIIPDEKTRIAAAYATLSAQSKGLTKTVLVDTAGQYIKVIEKDRQGFEDALKTKLQGVVDTRKKAIDDLAASIEGSHKQIAEIQKRIVEDEQRMKTLNEEAASAEMRIRKNEGAYLRACDAMIGKINNDIQKIQAIL